MRDKLLGTTTLEAGRAETIKQTYLLLGLSVAFAIAGGWVGATTPWIVNLFQGWLGWILAMVLINVIPRVAMAARHNPVLGVSALVADGFVSGLILAPILAIASYYAPNAVKGALAVTGLAFGGVTTFVLVSNKRFSRRAA
ncbi:MAG: Bax inhibitor-1 family protein [Bryobacterales bacterium]